MKTLRSNRSARRGGIARIAGFIAAGAMLATAAFAPASVAAANPSDQDVACNNIVNGARSPEYVWTTVDSAGVTANWATDAAHFDAANQPTVTIRVCVIDADGTNQGGIDQDTENDGSQLFPWSLLGYTGNPCPDSSLTFGSSADSPAVQTKKSDLIDCPAEQAGGDEPTDNAGDEPTDNAGDEPTDNAGDEPTDNAGDEPTDNAGDQGDLPTDSLDEPTGEVGGIVGTPGVTPPPTDTIAAGSASGANDGWRIALILMAAALIGSLAFTQPRRARHMA
jgi:hypothetical protein